MNLKAKEPQFIKIEKGCIKDIKGYIISERYKVDGILYNGNNSCVFNCRDTTKEKGPKLVIKFFEKNKDDKYEVRTLL